MSNGPRFFETRMGVRFFEIEVPKLIKVLERIATALEARNARPRPGEVESDLAPAEPAFKP